MRKLYMYIIFLSLIMFFSCEDKGITVNCDECLQEEPLKANIEVNLDINMPYQSTYPTNIKIYEGNLEDSLLIGSFLVHQEVWEFEADINKQYTFTATYATSDVTYIAVDSALPRVKYEPDQCNDPCYIVYDKKVSLKLKYTK
jgi:hypothetical protein